MMRASHPSQPTTDPDPGPMEATTLLYRDDYRRTFEAVVLSIDPAAGYLILDRTAFFPTGGHQACDQGRIEKNRSTYAIVTEVKKDEDRGVRHFFEVSKGSIQIGDRVTGSLDWRRRYHHMRLHTAQHIFSRRASDRLGVSTGRASFSPAGGKAVMERRLSWEEVFVLEDDVNRVITEGRNVTRRISDDEDITMVIEGLDENRCGGTHVRSTAEIGLFKITAIDGKNLYYEIGRSAERTAVRLANDTLRAASALAVDDPKGLANAVQETLERHDRARQEARRWKKQLTDAQVGSARRTSTETEDGTTVFLLDASHLSAKAVKDLLKKDLAENGQLWICLADRRNLLISSSAPAIDAASLMDGFRQTWGIRGAGAAGFAQGGPIPAEIDDPLSKIAERVVGPPTFNDQSTARRGAN